MFPKDSDKTAIFFENKKISYNELIKNIQSFAFNLKIKKGDRVLLFAENSPEWIYAFYSIWVNKGIAVPCDYNLKEQELSYILNNCTPEVIYCSLNTLPIIKKALKIIRFKPRVIVLERCKKMENIDIKFPEIK